MEPRPRLNMEDKANLRFGLSLALFVLSIVFICIRVMSSPSPNAKGLARDMWIGGACMFGAMVGISLEFAAMFVAIVLLGVGLIVGAGFGERRYHKRFPVFETEPAWSFIDSAGYLRELYIAECKSRFIIGIVYEFEFDDTETRQQTRWKDRFKTYPEAKAALWRRAADYGLTADTPVREGGQPSMRGVA